LKSICEVCPARSLCTSSLKTTGRQINLRLEPQWQEQRQALERQKTDEFKAQYTRRAGIEGTISQAVRAFELRQCRYVGLAKARLQHVVTAAAINIVRLAAWVRGEPLAQTRCSSFANLAAVS
jgi:transposase